MKIRTSFVTNSSSYSSAEIKIDNPVLLEILERYRDEGAFIDVDGDDLGGCIGMSEYEGKSWTITGYPDYEENEDDQEILDDMDQDPSAYYLLETEQADINFAPKRIEDVANTILNLIAGRGVKLKNKALFEECKKEIKARASEINKNYIRVLWEASNDSFGESEPEEGEETKWEFYYFK